MRASPPIDWIICLGTKFGSCYPGPLIPFVYRYTPEASPSAALESTPKIRVLGAELHVQVQLSAKITFCSELFERVSSTTENDKFEGRKGVVEAWSVTT
jgi:hypothetical protein